MLDELLLKLISFLEKKIGFFFDEIGKKKIHAIITKRMLIHQFNSIEDYFSYLTSLSGINELTLLISQITVGETYFSRYVNHWKAFKEYIIPHIINSRPNEEKKIKIWSAGCSTGEEPYTIAIAFIEQRLLFKDWSIDILATDINQGAIEIAKKGIYTKNSFRGVDEDWINRYFVFENGSYSLKDEIKQMVSFEQLNLITTLGFPLKYRNCDIIFCRNVLMYFRPEINQEVVKKFSSCLRDGGFFFLGHAEGIMAPASYFKAVNYADTFIYQKHTPSKKICDFFSLGKKIQPIDEYIPPKETKDNSLNNVVNLRYYENALDNYFKENYDKALEEILKEEKNNRDKLNSLILKGLIYIGMSNIDKADLCVQKAYKISDISAEVQALDAIIKEAKGNTEAALIANQAAIFLDKNFFGPHFKTAILYQNMAENQKASKHFSNALKLLEVDTETRIRLFSSGLSIKFLEDVCKRKCFQIKQQ
ncbi:MAG: hypothetical protein HQK76_14835 [Desulfobacterales bacterium]|nr:hypothetical protein [Desulfobacterales bacterium]